MTPSEARQILQLYREDAPDQVSSEIVDALALTRLDPELKAWFEKHQQVEHSLRRKFRSFSPPEHLRDLLLTRRNRILPNLQFQRRAMLAVAAVLFLLALASIWWMRPATPDHFADYRNRMISAVLRSYHMDIETSDPAKVRAFMAQHGSPDDFVVPKSLAQRPLAGGGIHQWRNHPVSMICFKRGDDQMLFLFVLRREALDDAPPAEPEIAQVNKLSTLSWSRGENVYLLAGPPEPGFREKYL